MENKNQEYLASLAEIRAMMERSSRFISLSGLSGVFAGIYALAGAAVAYFKFNYSGDYQPSWLEGGTMNPSFIKFVLGDAFLVLVLSLLTGIVFTYRKAKKQQQAVFGKPARKMLINMLIPLATGGTLCLILLYHDTRNLSLMAPATLIFYGLALLNGSKYTLDDIRYLGICEIVLGLIASVFMTYGLLFWAIGFGLLHIMYGVVMYYKHERNTLSDKE